MEGVFDFDFERALRVLRIKFLKGSDSMRSEPDLVAIVLALADRVAALEKQLVQVPESWYSDFADWLEREMPGGTVIGDPLWWASRIADRFIAQATREAPPVPQLGERISVEEVAELASAVLAGAQAASPEPAPLPQLPPEQEFPLRLYQLLEKFDAELLYDKNDDGVHIQIGSRKPLVGFMDRAELRDQLIEAGLLPDPDQLNGWDAAAGEVQP